MSPESRSRPPGGRRRHPAGRHPSRPHPGWLVPLAGAAGPGDAAAECWFGEPDLTSPRSWALPPAHGSYRGIDLELLDPDDENDRALLIEAQHPALGDALRAGSEAVIGGERVNPRLHLAMHQVVVSELMAAEPPEVWRTVRRLAGLGYGWHDIVHMIAHLVGDG